MSPKFVEEGLVMTTLEEHQAQSQLEPFARVASPIMYNPNPLIVPDFTSLTKKAWGFQRDRVKSSVFERGLERLDTERFLNGLRDVMLLSLVWRLLNFRLK
jgi:hypothetical protein